MRAPIFFGIAPGGADELRANGHASFADALPEIDTTGRDDAAIIGMRADAPGRVVPGTVSNYACRYCGERVRLAPSGQRMERGGAAVVCVECVPKLDTGGAST